MPGQSKSNHAAVDLWKQILKRLSEDKSASLWDPNLATSEDEALIRDGFKRAGWSDDEIDERLEFDKARIAAAPVTSPGINPSSELIFDQVCNDVEAAMERLNLQSHHRIARGIEPRQGPFASQTNVVMTDQGIVTVGTHLFRFCGLVARALVRTLNLNPFLWEDQEYRQTDAINLLRQYPDILSYWIGIFTSYALTGTNIIVPFKPATKRELVHFEQVARAMEVFAVAHEYGHHSLNHGRQLDHDLRADEFGADQFALRICYEVERKPVILPNPYLASGAGGVTLLCALKTLRSLTYELNLSSESHPDTHPPAEERIRRFDSVSLLSPDEFRTLRGFRNACQRIMSAVDFMLVSTLRDIPRVTRTALRSAS